MVGEPAILSSNYPVVQCRSARQSKSATDRPRSDQVHLTSGRQLYVHEYGPREDESPSGSSQVAGPSASRSRRNVSSLIRCHGPGFSTLLRCSAAGLKESNL